MTLILYINNVIFYLMNENICEGWKPISSIRKPGFYYSYCQYISSFTGPHIYRI